MQLVSYSSNSNYNMIISFILTEIIPSGFITKHQIIILFKDKDKDYDYSSSSSEQTRRLLQDIYVIKIQR